MNGLLPERVRAGLGTPVAAEVSALGKQLALESGAQAVLFYGSNLRTGELDGVLDFYVLLPGKPESGIWPRVSYREDTVSSTTLRAKIATMTLAKFAQAARGDLLDTTIWTRFAQPAALVWQADEETGDAVRRAIADAIITAARLACVLGPKGGRETEYWSALFEETYGAEFRIERRSRAQSILDLNRAHFDGLLPAALDAAGIDWRRDGNAITPDIGPTDRRRVRRWWSRRKRLGKAINVLRLVRAASTFEGAARYAAWKIERHSGVAVKITPWRERHPVLAAPGVLLDVWRKRRSRH